MVLGLARPYPTWRSKRGGGLVVGVKVEKERGGKGKELTVLGPER